MSVTYIVYKNNLLTSTSGAGSKILKTSGKYCEGNIKIISTDVPYEYQEVEYLKFNGTSSTSSTINGNYINLGNFTDTLKITAIFQTLAFNSPIFASTTHTTSCHVTPYSSAYYYGNGSGESHAGSISLNVKTTLVADGITNNLIVDGTSIATNLNITFSNTPLRINLRSGETSSYYTGNNLIYYFKVENLTKVLFELIPCYRKSDSVAGMYDIINNVFHTNDGTGEFGVGPDIN